MLGLLAMLLFAALQVGVYVYARTVVAAAASDGARYGGSEGIGPAAGAARADDVIAANLPASAHIVCSGSPDVDAASGLALATVQCRGRMRMLLVPLGIPVTIDVTASAVQEGAR